MKNAGKQMERLHFIDFMLLFCGSVSRRNLMDQFSIQTAGATRDLTKYRDEAPDNLYYDNALRTYFASKDFLPIYSHDPNMALQYFADQVDNDIHCETTTIRRPLRLDILSKITRSMYSNRAIGLTYHNPKSGTKKREYIPHSLVNDGLRWHVRGYCRHRSKFLDLVVSRVENVEFLDEDIDVSIESKKMDRQWNRYVDLEIIPHPGVKHTSCIVYEHEMSDGKLTIEVRAAVAGYFLRSWNVDCSPNHTLDPLEYTLWLKNRESLYGVGNLVIAPGYNLEE